VVDVLPGGCANDAQPFILPLDRVELELEELGDVPDEGEDLPHTVVNGRHRGEEVDDSLRDRLCSLRTCDQNRKRRSTKTGPTRRYANVGGGSTSSKPHQSTHKVR
jgi:hypothetical protein